MASTTDLITGVRDGTARPVATTVTASRSAGGTTLQVAATTGWDTSTKVHFQTYTTDASGNKVTASAADWSGIVSGTTITNLELTAGTDNGNSIGDTVECMPTAAWADELAQGLLLEHNADGTHDNTKVAMLAGAQTFTGVKTFPAGSIAATALGTGVDIQTVNSETNAVDTTTSTIPGDDTIPQNTEGKEFMSVSITPKATGNLLKVRAVVYLSASNNNSVAALFQDSTADAIAAVAGRHPAADTPTVLVIEKTVTAASTSATTFKLRAGLQSAGTLTFNGIAGTRQFGAITKSVITVTETKG